MSHARCVFPCVVLSVLFICQSVCNATDEDIRTIQVEAEKELIVQQLTDLQYSKADAAMAAFKKRYAGDPQYGVAMRAFADTCFYRTGEVGRAHQLYQSILDEGVSDAQLWARRGMAMVHLEEGDMASAASAIAALKANHCGQPGYGTALRDVAAVYRKRPDGLGAARQLYQEILEQPSSRNEQLWAHHGLVMVNIKLGDKAAADAAGEQLLSYADLPSVGKVFKEAADQFFYAAGDNERAVRLYAAGLQSGMDDERTVWTLSHQAVAYIRLDDRSAADAACQSLLSDYAGHCWQGKALKEVADAYYQAGDISQAGMVYQSAIDAGMDKTYLPMSLGRLAIAHIKQGDWAAADAICEKLPADYWGQSSLSPALKEIADYCFYHAKDSERAGSLYQASLDTGARGAQAMWSYRGMALCGIDSDRQRQAEEAIDMLFFEYAGQDRCPDAIKEVIDHYCVKGQADLALALSQRLQERFPSRKAQMLALGGMAQAYVLQGRNSEAAKIVDTILGEYRDEGKAAYAVFMVAEEYCKSGLKKTNSEQARADFEKSIAIIEQYLLGFIGTDPNGVIHADEANLTDIVDADIEMVDYPAMSSDMQSNAWYQLGLNYWYLGQWFSAADAFFYSIDANPNHEFAGSMHWMISDCYENLRRVGSVPAAEADAVIEWGYQTLFDAYPDSRDVEYAAVRLIEMNLARGRPVTALVYMNWFIDDSAFDDPRGMHLVHQLLAGMEVCGQ